MRRLSRRLLKGLVFYFDILEVVGRRRRFGYLEWGGMDGGGWREGVVGVVDRE